MKPLLLVWNDGLVKREEVTGFFETQPQVVNWIVAGTPNALVVTTTGDINQLGQRFLNRFPKTLIMLAPLDINNVFGWQIPNVWKDIRNPGISSVEHGNPSKGFS